MSSEPIYLDHHATTPCDPRVVEAMTPYFAEIFGNPSAISHEHGRRAALALDQARRSIASFFDVEPRGVLFTSGATEANNLILNSVREGDHVISSAIEHQSILAPLAALSDRGVEVTILPVDEKGLINPEQIAEAIRGETKLVTINWANGEIGTIEPIEKIARVCSERGVVFHSDATQAVGKVPVSLGQSGVNAISLSSHKLYGPKGIGALIISGIRRPGPLLLGGGQEQGSRSGTVNLPGVIGLARALEIRAEEMEAEGARLARLREKLFDSVTDQIAGARINGDRVSRLPGNASITFRGVDADALMGGLRGYSLSSGAACSAGSAEPSHVLRAIGLSDAEALSTVRVGMGRSTLETDMEGLIGALAIAVPKLRSIDAVGSYEP